MSTACSAPVAWIILALAVALFGNGYALPLAVRETLRPASVDVWLRRGTR